MTKELKFATLTLIVATSVACGRAQWQEAGRGTANAPGGQGSQTETPLDPSNPPVEKPVKPVKPGHYPPANFDSCSSQTLSVEVVISKTDKSNLQDFWTTTARYPRVKVTRVQKKALKSTFYLDADDDTMHACMNKTCAQQAGWSNIQDDLQDLNGVTVNCMAAARPVVPSVPPPPPPATL